jgi:hypothetical protein
MLPITLDSTRNIPSPVRAAQFSNFWRYDPNHTIHVGDTMKHLLTSILASGLLLAGAQVFAGDMQDQSASTHKQMMKDCMTRMQAKNDGSTHDQMKASCKAHMNDNMNKDDATSDQAMKPADKTPEK